jgi:hypothetical protein
MNPIAYEKIEYSSVEQAAYERIRELAETYSADLKRQVDLRVEEMKNDDLSHYLIYQVLGITDQEGYLIDLYQNKGWFLYKYAGSFLEQATILCMKEKYADALDKVRIPNPLGLRPKTFQIDCLVDDQAHQITWRDATTDGDHITKEHTRVRAIQEMGYTPVRVMFYYPNRAQARRVQETLETLYKGAGGKYYYGESAWNYIKDFTGIDLLDILHRIVLSR